METLAALTRRSATARPMLDVAGPLRLATGRAHEATGPARRTLAAIAACAAQARSPAPIVWIAPDWERDRPHGPGLAAFCDPGAVLFVRPGKAGDLLWCLEEVLRSGAVGLAVCELPEPPPLTPVRRLHLAAEAGAEAGIAPVGLLLTPGDGTPTGGAAGVESRWHLAPTHHVAPGSWRLARTRARTAPQAAWTLRRAAAGPERWNVTPEAPDPYRSDPAGYAIAHENVNTTAQGSESQG
ncbi:MAG: hypothetical protein ACU0CO_02635 [Shimia sp.]